MDRWMNELVGMWEYNRDVVMVMMFIATVYFVLASVWLTWKYFFVKPSLTPDHNATSVADVINSAFDDAVAYGHMNKADRKYWSKTLTSVGLPMIKKIKIRGFNLRKLKRRIKYRLGNGVYKTKPTIPGPAVGEVVLPISKSKKVKAIVASNRA